MGVKDIKYDIPMDMVDMDMVDMDSDNEDNDNNNNDNETKTMKTTTMKTTGRSTGPKASNLSHSWIRWTTGHGHSGSRKQVHCNGPLLDPTSQVHLI